MARWTKAELGILNRNYSTKGSKYVARKTGHPATSVVIKANSLGIRSEAIKVWSRFEVNYLLKNYGIKSPESIARSLKRNVTSVENKARNLGIYVPKPQKWSDAERALLKKLWGSNKYSQKEAAKILNKTYTSVHRFKVIF